MRHLVSLLFCFLIFVCPSKSQQIRINFVQNGKLLHVNNDEEFELQITDCKFYLSNIQLYQTDGKEFTTLQQHYLVDVQNSDSHIIQIDSAAKFSFNKIRFNIGIDSITNVSGALGGDLDPTMGMYWTWKSGYINFKLEGVSQDCKTRNNVFQFHLGGYSHPFNSLQNVELSIHDSRDFQIDIDPSVLLSKIDLKKINTVMSPNAIAMKLSKILPAIFSINE